MSLLLLAAAAASQPDWQLVWSDEFDGTALDARHWVLADDCFGGGNEERQCYTAREANHRVKDGVLEIIARREDHTGPAFVRSQRDSAEKAAATRTKPFTSARLSTDGKASWLYGKVQVRARLPQGQGTWPAIWMLPEDWGYGAWARSGEIDIMEAVNLGEPCATCSGGRENRVLGTIHFGGEPPRNRYISAETTIPGDPAAFHTYEVEWDRDGMVWRVDGKDYARREPHEWHTLGSDKAGAPFDRPFHLILNLAIGGHLPEGRNKGGVDAAGYPRTMAVDWVRVWQKRGDAGNAGPVTNGKDN
ncbi:glycoside hydrolase family 16 protein [Novosphingobium olei]|uniref:glycoside hydrolase family 16 protein n=1 Tax=Novosphingobium olei TaxID=2728851 RepID=UPI00308D9EF4|nr:glycoside hydrolase family 16 protein [Novosphingobium olei]